MAPSPPEPPPRRCPQAPRGRPNSLRARLHHLAAPHLLVAAGGRTWLCWPRPRAPRGQLGVQAPVGADPGRTSRRLSGRPPTEAAGAGEGLAYWRRRYGAAPGKAHRRQACPTGAAGSGANEPPGCDTEGSIFADGRGWARLGRQKKNAGERTVFLLVRVGSRPAAASGLRSPDLRANWRILALPPVSRLVEATLLPGQVAERLAGGRCLGRGPSF
jgi:hypothetical protein